MLIALTACASPTTPAAPAPASSGISVPPLPSGIAKTPTDKIADPGWTEGWIVRGGTGPCYGLLDLDGKPYAMYSDEGLTLAKGDHVRVRVIPSRLRIDCGEGEPVRLEVLEHVS
ncbi:hypothetical protein [Actinoplanes sp. RD1]|uniref:hypothetical protein n=1 Tax=Actinoplanes sp. RD1 TaxID=3064538 RepID=UPI002741CC4B|nr:hypothetical protein [Actinoplanes sp. RD1]